MDGQLSTYVQESPSNKPTRTAIYDEDVLNVIVKRIEEEINYWIFVHLFIPSFYLCSINKSGS